MLADAEFFEQLVSERLVTKKNRAGFSYQEWSLPGGKRNEKLDCTNYALAAKSVLKPDYKTWAESMRIKMQGYKPTESTVLTISPDQPSAPITPQSEIERLTQPRTRRKLRMKIRRR
jgi:phage terminase large subunit GpA-like protein